MNQLYCRGEDNLEVFTTVISPRVCRAARGRPQRSPQTLRRSVAEVSDFTPYWSDELLPYQGSLIDVLCKDDEVWRFGRLQNGQRVLFPVKCAAKEKKKPATTCTNKLDESCPVSEAQSPSSIHPGAVTQHALAQQADEDRLLTEQQFDCLHRNTTDDQAPPEGTDESLLLGEHTTPSSRPGRLKKMWLKHKKRSQYLGAKNGAFEAD